MNKEQLVDRSLEVCEVKLTKKQATAFLSAALKVVAKTVADGDKVTLVGFGTFEPRERKARKGINPRTKEEMDIPATLSVGFSVGKNLREMMAHKPE